MIISAARVLFGRASPNSRGAGFSCLEVQVALAVLGIVLAGLVPITHAQLRLMERLESDYPESQNHILAPLGDRWARKLGAPALLDPPLLPPVVPVPSDPGYSLELLQFNTDSTADITAARVRLIPVP